jgi:hypothetical protein
MLENLFFYLVSNLLNLLRRDGPFITGFLETGDYLVPIIRDS